MVVFVVRTLRTGVEERLDQSQLLLKYGDKISMHFAGMKCISSICLNDEVRGKIYIRKEEV